MIINWIKKCFGGCGDNNETTIQFNNIKKFLEQGLDPDEIENAVSRKLDVLDDMIVSVEFVLNVQSIADTVQPETDRLLGKL